ncbi:PhzF family phenazine biosynthesis protein [Chryseobacterium sp.]|uniref:PhzF family phenazine biosynthesis protein n=1 Tax=Chryseobacterium sp. TaxID=1871047 RepID=UPI0028974679|nr:PhzF family phenazine biosynthesis protein [Chryseobacterium sp.]
MKLSIYQVDAFTDTVFKGNPAAVCPLTEWLPDVLLQQIAAENNLSETAFYVANNDGYEIRWYTPTSEVDLCGHATLATSYVISQFDNPQQDIINFHSPRSGKLVVTRDADLFKLNFPVDIFQEVPLTEELIKITDKKPNAAYKGKTDYMLVFDKQEDIESIKPDLSSMAKQNARGFIVTAPGNSHDFVSRFFGPAVGVNEDPVCGSAHTTLVPFWAVKLKKNELKAFQVSQRTGELTCRLLGDRVELAGKAVIYLKGEIYI